MSLLTDFSQMMIHNDCKAIIILSDLEKPGNFDFAEHNSFGKPKVNEKKFFDGNAAFERKRFELKSEDKVWIFDQFIFQFKLEHLNSEILSEIVSKIYACTKDFPNKPIVVCSK